RITPGAPHLFMPAVSPSGRWLAVAGYSEAPSLTRLLIVDLRTQRSNMGPHYESTTDVLPAWVDDDTLVYVGIRESRAILFGYSVSDHATKPLRQVNIPGELADAYQAAAGLGPRLGPAGEQLALYDYSADAVRL